MSGLRPHLDDRPVCAPHADETGRPQTDGQDNEPAASVVVLGQRDESFPASGWVLASGSAPGFNGSAPHRLDVNLGGGEEEIPPTGLAAEEEVLHIRVEFRLGGQVVVELVFEFLDDGRPYCSEQRRPLRLVPLHYFFNHAVRLWARELLRGVEAVGLHTHRLPAVMAANGELHFALPPAALPARGWDSL